MKDVRGGIYAVLGVSTPFDPGFTLVTPPLLPPPALAALRLAFAIYGTFFVVFRLVYEGVKYHSDASYFSYFTDLSYIGLLSYFWASGVQTLFFALSLRRRRRTASSSSPAPHYPLQRWPCALQFLHLLLLSTVTTFPILVTAVFWSLLSGPATLATRYSAWVNISEHAMNTAFAGVEILATNVGPGVYAWMAAKGGRRRTGREGVALPWVHVPFLILLLAGYLGVAYITSGTQHFYTYSFLDPHTEHAKLAAYIVGIAVAEAVIFAVVRHVMMLRAFVVARVLSSRLSGYAEDQDAEHGEDDDKKEGLEDWEEVGRPSFGSGERGVAL